MPFLFPIYPLSVHPISPLSLLSTSSTTWLPSISLLMPLIHLLFLYPTCFRSSFFLPPSFHLSLPFILAFVPYSESSTYIFFFLFKLSFSPTFPFPLLLNLLIFLFLPAFLTSLKPTYPLCICPPHNLSFAHTLLVSLAYFPFSLLAASLLLRSPFISSDLLYLILSLYLRISCTPFPSGAQAQFSFFSFINFQMSFSLCP